MRTALLTAVTGSLVFAFVAFAAGIVGTDRGETIRGTAGADRISGKGGNDVLIGNGGRDVVDGGRGADRLSLRDGERDTAICGPGRDVVLADRADVVLGDCEVLRVVPPEPVALPPRPVVAGLYGGRTTQGQLVTFQVSSGGELSRLALPVMELACTGGPSVTWSQDFGAVSTVVQRDGTFAIEETGTRELAGSAATYRIVVSGLLTVGIAAGSVQIDVELAQPTNVCTAPGLRWTAAAAVLTGPWLEDTGGFYASGSGPTLVDERELAAAQLSCGEEVRGGLTEPAKLGLTRLEDVCDGSRHELLWHG